MVTATQAQAEDDAIENAAKEWLDGNVCLSDLRGITRDEIEALYRFGYQRHEAGRYADARAVFAELVMLEHTEARFWVALGAAAQGEGAWPAAIEAYAMGALLDATDAWTPLHGAECCAAAGQWTRAEQAADAAQTLAVFKPCDAESEKILKRCARLKRRIERDRKETPCPPTQ